jgi:hypothetical protein
MVISSLLAWRWHATNLTPLLFFSGDMEWQATINPLVRCMPSVPCHHIVHVVAWWAVVSHHRHTHNGGATLFTTPLNVTVALHQICVLLVGTPIRVFLVVSILLLGKFKKWPTNRI